MENVSEKSLFGVLFLLSNLTLALIGLDWVPVATMINFITRFSIFYKIPQWQSREEKKCSLILVAPRRSSSQDRTGTDWKSESFHCVFNCSLELFLFRFISAFSLPLTLPSLSNPRLQKSHKLEL